MREDTSIMINDLGTIEHVGSETFWQDQFAAIPVKATSCEYKFGAVVELLKVIVCEFSALPADCLPAIEQCDAAANKSDCSSDVRDNCCGFTQHDF